MITIMKKKQLRANGDVAVRAGDRFMHGIKAMHGNLAADQTLPSGAAWELLDAMPSYGTVTARQLRRRALDAIGHVTSGPQARSIGVAVAILCGMYLVRRQCVHRGQRPDGLPDILHALQLEAPLGGPDHDHYWPTEESAPGSDPFDEQDLGGFSFMSSLMLGSSMSLLDADACTEMQHDACSSANQCMFGMHAHA